MKTGTELQQDVLDEIAGEPSVSAPEIGVAVHNGIVTLTGSVDTLPAKRGAEKAALRVAGVKAVTSSIEVKLSTGNCRPDEDIACAVSNVLTWNILLPKHLQAVVKDGWVTLTGIVQRQFQKKVAGDAVEWLTGVKGVTNNITVKPHFTPLAIQGKIEAALRRQAALDMQSIIVSVEAGIVTLEGAVGSWAEKEEAENAAWTVPGIIRVDNKLSIQDQKLQREPS